MDFSGVSSFFVGLFFFFALLYQYDTTETFLTNQIFNPATINFSTALSGVENRTHSHKLLFASDFHKDVPIQSLLHQAKNDNFPA